MEVQLAITSRRSIRKYKSTAVADEVLEQILEAARWAPSWANTQCWRFIVVRNAETINKLATTIPENNPALKAIKVAPVVIVACAQLGKAGYIKGKVATDKGDWYMFDVALAMQNLVLAAHAQGLGTVYIGRFDAQKVATILKIPDGFSVVAITPLGYPDLQPTPIKQLPHQERYLAKLSRSRKALSEIVSYERFNFL